LNDDHKEEAERAEEIAISYECTLCKRSFNKRTDFKDHMKDHAKVKIILLNTLERKQSYWALSKT